MGLEEDLQKALEAKDKGNQGVAALKACIVNGESLGNPIKDYLFVQYGMTEFPGVEEQLKKLSDKIKAYNDQQVMVLYTKEEVISKGDGGCFGGGDLTRLEITGQQLGILNGELKFNLTNGNIVLPTNKHVQKGDDLHIWDVSGFSWEVKEGNIAISGYHYQPSYFMEDHKLSKPKILLGDEVELYFSVGSSYFEQYLSSRNEAWKNHLLEDNNYINNEYLSALNLLGISVPERFQQKYDTRVERQRTKVLEQIKNQKEAKHYLPQALELSLHKEPREIQLEPGITMNLPEYIRAQCDKHGIKIPE